MNRLARFAGFGRHHEEQAEMTAVTGRRGAVERMDPEELREPIIEALRERP